MDIEKRAIKGYSHSLTVTCGQSAVSLPGSGEQRYVNNKSDRQQERCIVSVISRHGLLMTIKPLQLRMTHQTFAQPYF